MNLSRTWNLIKQSASAWVDDYAPSMGAALAYYTLFSIAPVLIIVIAVAGFFFGEQAARGEIMAQLQGLLGEKGAIAVEALLESASEPAHGAVATIISVIVLIIGATTVFAELQSDLDRIWHAPAAQNEGGVWGLIRARLLSLGMVLAIGFLLLVSLVASAALSAENGGADCSAPGKLCCNCSTSSCRSRSSRHVRDDLQDPAEGGYRLA